MKTLLSFVAVASLVLLSLDAHSKLATNGESLNGVGMNGLVSNKLATNKIATNGIGLNGLSQTVDLRGLAQAPLVKAH